MIFLKREMALDFRFYSIREVGKKLRNYLIFRIRRTISATRSQLLKALHQRDGRAMLVV